MVKNTLEIIFFKLPSPKLVKITEKKYLYFSATSASQSETPSLLSRGSKLIGLSLLIVIAREGPHN